MTFAAFFSAWLIHLVAAASPGPAVLMSARIAVTEGLRAAIWVTIGLGIGAVLWAAAALFGLALLFKVAPALFIGFKVAGALFLLWIALQMWRHAGDPLPQATTSASPRGVLSALWLGIATQLANPKPAVFFGAVFVGTVPADTNAAWMLLLLAVIFANEVACNIIVARLFSFDRSRRAYTRLKAGIDRCFAGLLSLVAVKIAAT